MKCAMQAEKVTFLFLCLLRRKTATGKKGKILMSGCLRVYMIF